LTPEIPVSRFNIIVKHGGEIIFKMLPPGEIGSVYLMLSFIVDVKR